MAHFVPAELAFSANITLTGHCKILRYLCLFKKQAYDTISASLMQGKNVRREPLDIAVVLL